MNEVNVLLADNPNFKFVDAVFAPYTGSKAYTYKTLLDIEVDDYAVVETPSNGFQVVKVLSVVSPMEVDFDQPFSFKWLVQKIDSTAYDKAVALEADILKTVNKSKNTRALKEARERVLEGLDSDTADTVTKLVRL